MKYLKLFNNFLKENINTDLTKTPAFKKWFGNWENDPENSSKVVDERGNPLIVYHGGNSEFDHFDFEKISTNSNNYGHYGYGFYFSKYRKEAQTYGNIIYECFLNIKKPFTGTDEEYNMLRKANININSEWIIKSIDKNDLIVKLSKVNKKYGDFLSDLFTIGYEEGWSKFIEDNNDFREYSDILNDLSDVYKVVVEAEGVPEHCLELLKSLGIDIDKLKYIYGFDREPSLHYITNLGDYSLTKEFTDFIISKGYDGVFYDSEYIVFKSNQVKLVDGSNTRFSDSGNIKN